MVRILLIALLLLPVMGCAPRLRPVAVEFRNLNLQSFDRGDVSLLVSNPNRTTIEVETLRYLLTLGADTVAFGERAEPLRVPAQDTVQIDLEFEIRFSFEMVFNRLGSLLDDTLQLSLDGRYSVPGFLGPKNRRFSYRHSVPLRSELNRLTEPLRSLFDSELQ